MDGQELTFYLVGINNQNFVMADHQTGTWWQQVTGEAIRGPLAGKQLELMPWDEVSFSIWRHEFPATTVLASSVEFEDKYREDDEGNRDDYKYTVEADPDAELDRGELIVGLQLPEGDKAYPMASLLDMTPVIDTVGDRPVLVVVADDGQSVRAFDRRVDGQELDLYRKLEESGEVSDEYVLIDANTGSEWDFTGMAISGPMAGRRLERLQTLKDYWFDWHLYHPDAQLFQAGQLR